MSNPFKNIRVPKGGFKVILADNPWPFKTRGKNGHGKSPERHYPTMSIEDMALLPVEDIAADGAVLFFWTTWPMLLSTKALDCRNSRNPHKCRQNVINYIVDLWGFEYSGLAWEWDKRSAEGVRSFGGGYTTRKNLEPCILARRGRLPPVLNRSVTDLITAPRRLHSQKPGEQYERIEKMFDGPYLELFAIDKRKGWTQWNPKKHR